MIRNSVRILPVVLFLSLLGILGACGKNGASTDGEVVESDGSGGIITEEGGTESPEGEPGEDEGSVADATGGIGAAISEASQDLSSEDMAKLMEALSAMSGKLEPVGDAMSAVTSNPTTATAKAAEDALSILFNGGFSSLIDFFDFLKDPKFFPLLRKLRRFDQLRPVYGGRWSGHPTKKSRHFYTNSFAEFFKPIIEGTAVSSTARNSIAFWVYEKPWETCTAQLYRCYDPRTEGDFVSRKTNCGGSVYKRKDAWGRTGKTDGYGYVCAKKPSNGEAPLALERFFYPNGGKNTALVGDYVVTRSKSAAKTLKKQGWKSHGSLGFPPSPPRF